MYLPRHFEENRIEVLHAMMRSHPLAALVVSGPDGLNANHIPLYLDAAAGSLGSLQGHVARANPLWKELAGESAALAIFQGPQTYISPSWNAAKAQDGKVVPTWNYVVVHAHGRLCVHDDPAWIRGQIERMTDSQEQGLPAPWSVAEAPPDFLERMIGAVVGIELPIDRLTGKWKVSQNQPARSQDSISTALAARDGDAAQAMAALVRERRKDTQ